ncbi:hypothetical protein U1Q18_014491 [Sarracenia purpurea var. burkii]
MPSDEVPVKTVGTGPGNFLKVHCEAENVSASKVFDILPQRKPASCLAVNDTGKDVKSAEGYFPGSFGDVVKSEEKEIVSDEDEEGSEEDYTTEEDDGNNEGDSEVNDDRHAIALGFTKECSEVISNGEIKLNHVENCYEVVDLERKEVSAVKRKQTEDKEVQVIDAHQVFDGRPETFFGKEKQGSALDVDRISISESPLPGFCALEVGLNGGPGVDAMKTHRGNKGDKHNHMLDILTGPIADANTAAVSYQVFAGTKETVNTASRLSVERTRHQVFRDVADLRVNLLTMVNDCSVNQKLARAMISTATVLEEEVIQVKKENAPFGSPRMTALVDRIKRLK